MADPASTADFGARLGGVSEVAGAFTAWLQSVAEATRAMLADAGETWGRLPQAAALLTDNGDKGSAAGILLQASLTIAAALLAALLVRLGLARLRRRIGAAEPPTPHHGARLFLRGLFADLAPPAAYLGVAMLLDRALFGPGGVLFSGSDVFRMTMRAIIADTAIPWMAAIALVAPLAPTRPALRLLRLSDSDAVWAASLLRRIVAVGAAGWLLAETLFVHWLGDGVPRLILIAAAAAIGVMLVAALLRVGPHLRHFARFWQGLALLCVTALGAVWAHDLTLYADPPFRHVLGTLAVLYAIAVVDGLSRMLLHELKRHLAVATPRTRTIYAPSASAEDEELHRVETPVDSAERSAAAAEIERALDVLVATLHEAVSAVLLVAAIFALAWVWSIDLLALLGSGETRHFPGRVADAAIAVAIGWYVWRLFEAMLGVQLSREAGALQGRARTVQPLLRSVGKLLIGATALMSALSALGLNIAPLIASAGVIGIAVGFGAQTLVRDLFSGAFYLLEDVFRIGDYIEGGTAKGTVEKITFRTVALRHQNGPIHFVPYGALGSVRNNSRDWVIDKFEIPLPVTVDSEQIRKMVKKIGEAMQEEPEFGPSIMTPLKAKLYRIDPGVKLFRCKVQTPPGKQFEIRAEAYRRIEAALKKAGINFVDTARITVNATPPAPEETSETLPASSAAALAPVAAG